MPQGRHAGLQGVMNGSGSNLAMLGQHVVETSAVF